MKSHACLTHVMNIRTVFLTACRIVGGQQCVGFIQKSKAFLELALRIPGG
jgi:hypothetical protein